MPPSSSSHTLPVVAGSSSSRWALYCLFVFKICYQAVGGCCVVFLFLRIVVLRGGAAAGSSSSRWVLWGCSCGWAVSMWAWYYKMNQHVSAAVVMEWSVLATFVRFGCFCFGGRRGAEKALASVLYAVSWCSKLCTMMGLWVCHCLTRLQECARLLSVRWACGWLLSYMLCHSIQYMSLYTLYSVASTTVAT